MPYSFNPFTGNFDGAPTVPPIEGVYFPLSGGTITGATRFNANLTVYGNISATGTSYFANTVYSTTSALSVVNLGNTGPALYVGNNGTGDIASFYDMDQNVEVLHIGGSNGSFPNVGIKISNPNKDFTVNGELSASNTIYDATGNSNQWNSVYNTVASNSATTWNYQGTDLKALSAEWVGGNSAYTTVNANSGNWESVYTNVFANSAAWFNYIRKFDSVITDEINYFYSGVAAEGTLDSDPFWKITRQTFDDVGSLSSIGVAQNVTWNERLTATYA